MRATGAPATVNNANIAMASSENSALRRFTNRTSCFNVLACSALRQAYRDRISRAGNVRYVHLSGDHDTIAARLAARKNHYMPPTLLASQLATLEAPTDAIVIDVSDAVPVQVAKIRAALKPNFGNA